MLRKQYRGKTKCLVEIGKRPFIEKSLQSSDCMRATSTALRKLLVLGEISYPISALNGTKIGNFCAVNLICFSFSLSFQQKVCF